MENNKYVDINSIISEVYGGLEKNNFATLGEKDIPMWQPPLIGVAKGDDPYFQFLKTHMGSFHRSPKEVFALKYGEVDSSDLRVVVMAFPQSEEAKRDQQAVKAFPCDKWVVSRGEWEPLMKELGSRLVNRLESEGIRSVSIDLPDEFHLEKSENLGIASTWSHRHAAYAAGLGTFGLTDAIITEKGTAVRITSLIVDAHLEVTERSYDGAYDWCLHYQKDKECDICVSRCPAGAMSREGHDKVKCGEYEDYIENNMWPEHLEKGDYIFGCGICQVGVPCQNKRP